MSFPESILIRHGSPKRIMFERGAHFITRLMEEVMRLSHMSHRKNPTYHPQTKGLREHVKKDLADMFPVYVDVEHNTWDTILPFMTFAYNTTVQETTGFSPFGLVHGREAMTALTLSYHTTPYTRTTTMTLRTSRESAYTLRESARGRNSESTPAVTTCHAGTPTSTMATKYGFGRQSAVED